MQAKFRTLVYSVIVLIGSASLALAQAPDPSIRIADSSQIQRIKMRDGGALIGRIVEIRNDTAYIEGSASRTAMPVGNIKSVTTSPSSALHDGEYWIENSARSRLMFGPTGEMLKPGEGYVSDYEFVLVGGAVGVTKNITVGGGVLLPSPADIYFFTPKVGFSPSANVHVATGAIMFKHSSDSEMVGVYYGAASLGQTDSQITGGIGYGFAGSEVTNKPVIMLGGQKRFSNRMSVVTENYFVSGITPLVSLGVRFIGEKLSADLGFMNISDDGGSIIIPLVNFAAHF